MDIDMRCRVICQEDGCGRVLCSFCTGKKKYDCLSRFSSKQFHSNDCTKNCSALSRHFAFISSLIISVTNCEPRKHIVPRLSYTRLDGGICTPLNSDVKVYRYVASRDCCLTLPHQWPENCPVIIFSTIKRTSLRTDNN